MEETRIDEVTTPAEGAEASVPRRFAVQSIVGSLAGLAALGAASAGAQEKKKKAANKKNAKQKSQAKRAAARSGTLSRIRQATDAINVPSQTDRTLTIRCPRGNNNERVFVVGGGYAHNSNSPNVVINVNAPGSNTSWEVTAHNHTGGTISLGGNAICAYFRK